MKSISIGSFAGAPPAWSALSASSSTCSLLSADSATIASVCVVASASCFFVKSLKRSSTSSMTNASSLTIMQVACSSVKRGSNEKPSWVKKSTDSPRSLTARLTNILRDDPVAMAPSSGSYASTRIDLARRANSSLAAVSARERPPARIVRSSTSELEGNHGDKADSGGLQHRHAVSGGRRRGAGDRVLQEGVRREGARAHGRPKRQDRPCGARDRGLAGDAFRSVPARDNEAAEGAGRHERERLHVRRGRRRGRQEGRRR